MKKVTVSKVYLTFLEVMITICSVWIIASTVFGMMK